MNEIGDDQIEYRKRLEAADRERRRVFAKAKTLSNEKFWNWQNYLHSQAYQKAVSHFTQALESTQGISAAKVQEVIQRATTIRTEWDGMHDINIDQSELIVKGEDGKLKG